MWEWPSRSRPASTTKDRPSTSEQMLDTDLWLSPRTFRKSIPQLLGQETTRKGKSSQGTEWQYPKVRNSGEEHLQGKEREGGIKVTSQLEDTEWCHPNVCGIWHCLSGVTSLPFQPPPTSPASFFNWFPHGCRGHCNLSLGIYTRPEVGNGSASSRSPWL